MPDGDDLLSVCQQFAHVAAAAIGSTVVFRGGNYASNPFHADRAHRRYF